MENRSQTDSERDLFVQAFWVKCREVIRPQIDEAVTRLEAGGRKVGVSSQEFEEGAAPSLTLTVDAPEVDASRDTEAPDSAIHFIGDTVRQTVVVRSSGHDENKPSGTLASFDLSQVDARAVKAIIDAWI